MMNGSTIEEGSRADFKRCVLNTAKPFPKYGDKYTLYAINSTRQQTIILRFQVAGVNREEDWIKITPKLPEGLEKEVGHGVMTLTRFLEEEDFGLIERGWDGTGKRK